MKRPTVSQKSDISINKGNFYKWPTFRSEDDLCRYPIGVNHHGPKYHQFNSYMICGPSLRVQTVAWRSTRGHGNDHIELFGWVSPLIFAGFAQVLPIDHQFHDTRWLSKYQERTANRCITETVRSWLLQELTNRFERIRPSLAMERFLRPNARYLGGRTRLPERQGSDWLLYWNPHWVLDL